MCAERKLLYFANSHCHSPLKWLWSFCSYSHADAINDRVTLHMHSNNQRRSMLNNQKINYCHVSLWYISIRKNHVDHQVSIDHSINHMITLFRSGVSKLQSNDLQHQLLLSINFLQMLFPYICFFTLFLLFVSLQMLLSLQTHPYIVSSIVYMLLIRILILPFTLPSYICFVLNSPIFFTSKPP